MPALYRLMMPVPDIEAGVRFYAELLGQPGERVAPARHYFDCGIVLAVLDPQIAENRPFAPTPEWTYLAVDDLEATLAAARTIEGVRVDSEIEDHPWGERSAYLHDPFGNPLCLVQAGTEFTGSIRPPGTA